MRNSTGEHDVITEALAEGTASITGKSTMKNWLPLMIQTIALIGGGLAWSTAQEHRITIIEESLKTEKSLIEQQQRTQELMIAQLQATQKTLDHLVTLEDFMHGSLDQSEAEAFYRYKQKAGRK